MWDMECVHIIPSSIAMTTSTASNESKSRSSLNRAAAVTLPLFTYVKINDTNRKKSHRMSVLIIDDATKINNDREVIRRGRLSIVPFRSFLRLQ